METRCVHLLVSLILLTVARGQRIYHPRSVDEQLIEDGCKQNLDRPNDTETTVALIEYVNGSDSFFVFVSNTPNEDNYTEDCPTGSGESVTIKEYRQILFIFESGTCSDILFFVDNGNPVVCLYLIGGESFYIYYDIPVWLAATTLLVISLSAIASILLLVTHIIFSSLRTLPTKVIMNLALAFLAGDVCVIVVTVLLLLETDRSKIDIAVVVSFYFFYARFTWMALSGFEMCRNIYVGTKLRFDSEKKQRKLLFGYVVFGWIIAILPTVIVAVVHYEELEGKDKTRASHFGIGGYVITLFPVGLVMLFNVGIVVGVSVILHKARQWQTKVTDALAMQKSRRSTNFTRIFIIVLSVLGLTWSSVFVLYLDNTSDALLIVTSALNASQPIFVCAAFIGTKKILHKYMSLCGYKHKEVDVGKKRRSMFRSRRLLSYLFTDKDLALASFRFSRNRNKSGISQTSVLSTSRSAPSPQQTSDGSIPTPIDIQTSEVVISATNGSPDFMATETTV